MLIGHELKFYNKDYKKMKAFFANLKHILKIKQEIQLKKS